MCRLICNLPELSIRIFNPITSYFLINRYESRVSESRKILYHHKAFHNWLAPNFNSQFSLPNSHFPIPNFHFSIFNYPPFYPPKEHNSKKC